MRKFSFEAEPSADVMAAIGLLMPLVNNFRMEDIPGKLPSPKAKRKGVPRGSKVDAIIMDRLRAGPCGTGDLGDALEKGGFKASSASPALSRMKHERIVSWDHTDAKWSLV